MRKMQKLGVGMLLAGMSLSVMTTALAADPQVDRRRFESVGSVDSIAPFNDRVVIDGKRYRLAKSVKLIGLEGAQNDTRSALLSIRDKRIGYALGSEDGVRVVSAIMVLPEK